MKWFPELRAIALLRKIAKSLESQEESLATLARIETERWEKENYRRTPVKLKPFTMNVDEAEKEWTRRNNEI